ncbi:MAG: pantoate--beta-alanine ligase [Hyphomonadaceae bacterium]|nr:pantoate--beta-alanine ligase [Hyphomonadaceae bacterium]
MPEPIAITTTRQGVRDACTHLRAGGARLGLVPTMGALHKGHLALVEEARRHADHVVVSVFVNPTQFAPHEDFDRYPRQLATDAAMLAQAGASLIYAPDATSIYPPGDSTRVHVGGVSAHFEGRFRPHFFEGVASVVARLLIHVAPDVAVFGEKDFQQLAVIRRMTADLGLPVEIAGVATVREADGLALSSRNAYLDAAAAAGRPGPDTRFRQHPPAVCCLVGGNPADRQLRAGLTAVGPDRCKLTHRHPDGYRRPLGHGHSPSFRLCHGPACDGMRHAASRARRPIAESTSRWPTFRCLRHRGGARDCPSQLCDLPRHCQLRRQPEPDVAAVSNPVGLLSC